MARRRGPSPLVPALMVGVLGLIVFFPYVYVVVGIVASSFQADADADAAGDGSSTSFIMQLLLVFLMFLIRFLTASNSKAPYTRK